MGRFRLLATFGVAARPSSRSALAWRRSFNAVLTIMIVSVFLSACGGTPQASAPTTAPAAPTTAAPAAEPTAAAPAATEAPAAEPTEAPAAATEAPTEATEAPTEATEAPAAEPTEAAAAPAGGGKVLRVGINVPPGDFNPLTATNGFQYWVLSLVMSQLTVADTDKLAVAPSLAESWEVAEDGSSVTFKLNPDAKWHDGEPVTANDVAFTFRTALDPEAKSSRASAFALIKGAKAFTAGEADDVPGIVVVDDQTVRFDMEFPNGLFVNEVAQRAQILPEHLLGDIPPAELAKQPFFTSALVGSGPFKFVQYVPDQYVELEANPDYHLGKPKIDRIIVSIIKSLDTMQVALSRGELDFVITDGGPLPRAAYEEFSADDRFKVIATGGGPILGYGFNHRKDYLTDPRLHQAFLYAIDRAKIVQNFMGGVGTLPNSFMVHPWYQKSEWASMYPYDPEKAKALLTEMNWDTNRELLVNILPVASEDDRAILAAQQQMLADVGIKIQFQEMESSVWAEKFYDTHDYELAYVTFGVFPDPDGFLYWHMHSTSKNAFGYANPELDAKIEAGRRATTQEARIPIYQEIADEMLQNVPLASVYRQNFLFILNKNWSIPQVDSMQAVTSLSDLGPGKRLFSDFDVFLQQPEQWDLK